jgi:hypothetical protein
VLIYCSTSLDCLQAALQPLVRALLGSVAECDHLEAAIKHAPDKRDLVESAAVSCHGGSLSRSYLLAGSCTGPATGSPQAPGPTATATRPGVAKLWLVIVTLVAALGLGTWLLMIPAG